MPETHVDFYKRWHDHAKPYFAWQLQQLKPYLGQRIIDVGCGLGNFTEFFTDANLYLGVDVNSELLNHIKGQFSNRNNMAVYHGDITKDECVSFIKSKHADTIICLNVLEHIKDDKMAIDNMIDALPVNGYLCILVPAFQILYGSLDVLDGHFRRYDKTQISAVIPKSSAQIVEMFYFNWLGALGWFLKSKVLREKNQKNENYRIMNFLLPILRGIEILYKPPFGLSLIVIIRKISPRTINDSNLTDIGR